MIQEELEIVAEMTADLKGIPLQGISHYCDGFKEGFSLCQRIECNKALRQVATKIMEE